MQSEIQTLFSNVLLVCEELSPLDGTHFSLDGGKLSANVSKEWSGTIDELKHKRDKLQEKLQRLIAEHAQADRQPEVVAERQKKRERRFQFQVERLNEFLKDREPKRGSDGKEIQSNAVDNESVKMPTSHGVLQGYNAQALVDSKHQVILAAEAFASQDHENLEPMLAGAIKNLQSMGKDETYFEEKQLTADSYYHSLKSLTVCKDQSSMRTYPTSSSANAIRALRINDASRMASTGSSDLTTSQVFSPLLTSLSIQPSRCISVRRAKS